MKKGIIRKILKWMLIVLITLVAIFIMVTMALRITVRHDTRMNGENSVDERIYLPLGGEEQFISIRGEDTSNPVIISLHGGPATPTSFADHTWQCRLTDRYTFISWDQRGAGRTWYENRDKDPGNETVTMEQMLSDLDELVDYARKRFDKDEIILMGHSWGTILGAHYCSLHPGKIEMFVSVGQAVSSFDGEMLAYKEARRRALSRSVEVHDLDKAWTDWLAAGGSMESLQDLRLETMPYLKVRNAVTPFEKFMTWLSSPYMGRRDIKWIFSQFDTEVFFERNERLFSEVEDFDMRKDVPSLEVPVIFITGSDDWVTPPALVKEYKEVLESPYAVLTQVSGSGHMVMFDDPVNFTSLLDRTIRSVRGKMNKDKAVLLIPRKNIAY